MPTQKSATARFARKKFVIERSRRDKVTTRITRRLPARKNDKKLETSVMEVACRPDIFSIFSPFYTEIRYRYFHWARLLDDIDLFPPATMALLGYNSHKYFPVSPNRTEYFHEVLGSFSGTMVSTMFGEKGSGLGGTSTRSEECWSEAQSFTLPALQPAVSVLSARKVPAAFRSNVFPFASSEEDIFRNLNNRLPRCTLLYLKVIGFDVLLPSNWLNY